MLTSDSSRPEDTVVTSALYEGIPEDVPSNRERVAMGHERDKG